MKLKYYEIVDYPKKGINSGRFSGKSPGRVASKVFSKLAKYSNFSNADNKKIIVFSIKEKKKGNLKEKKYVGTRIALVKPNIVTLRNGKEIIYRYMNVVTSYNKYFEKN